MNLLSNMISIIKVGCIAKHTTVTAQNSKICVNVLSVMYRLGYIRGFIIENKKTVRILLKYINNKPTIRNINVISTPGRRVYMSCEKITKLGDKSNSGSYIISTSKGVITNLESSMFAVGGEVLVRIS